MRILTILLVLLPFALPLKVGALGLGEIELLSALNEPLDARIPLRAVKGGDLEALRVSIASAAQFERAGLERPYVLSSLRFNVTGSGSRGVIKITTDEPVTEPFLNFLIDLDWNRGRVIREYTVLLDPPIYGAAISATVDEAVTTVDTLPEIADPQPQVVTTTTDTSGSTVSTTTSSATSTTNPANYSVRTGDTLWSIADRFRPAGATVQQSMLAILRANPEAFSQSNVNALQAGAVLKVPNADTVESISASAALAEVKQQHALWEEYRQAATTSVSEASTGAVATSSGTESSEQSTQADEIPAPGSTQSTDEAQLSLVSGGTAQTGAGGDTTDVAALQEELLAAAEETDAERRQNEELSSKLAEADKIITDLQRLVDVKDDDIASLQARLAETEAELAATQEAAAADTSSEDMTSAVDDTASQTSSSTQTSDESEPEIATETETVTETETETETETTEPVVADQQRVRPAPQSFVDKLLTMLPVDPVLLAGGVGGLLALILGGVFFAKRRKSKAEWVDLEVDESVEVDGTQDEADEHAELAQDLPVEEADEFSFDDVEDEVDEASETVASMAAPELEDDPLEGLNIYLAYEDYDNATKLVKGVIAQHPERHEYKLRLLEIYYAAKNLVAFEDSAKDLQSAVGDDSPMMEKAHRWWDELGTGRALFAPVEETAGVTDDVVSDEEAIFDVTGANDSALGKDDTMEISLDDVEAQGDGGGVDFDLGFEFESTSDDADGTVAGDGELDFSLDRAQSPSEPVVESDEFDLDFSLDTDDTDGAGLADIQLPKRAEADSEALDIDFDLDSGDETTSGAVLDLDTTVDMSQVPQDDDSSGSIAAGVAAVGGLAAAGVAALATRDDTGDAASGEDSIDFDLDIEGVIDDGSDALAAADGADELDFSLDDDGALDFSLDATTPLDETDSDSESDVDALDVSLDVPETEAVAGGETTSDDTVEIDEAQDDDALDFALDLEDEPATETAIDDDLVLDFDLGDGGTVDDETATGEFAIDAAAASDDAAAQLTADGDADETVDLSSDLGDLDLDFDMSLDDNDDSAVAEASDDALDLDFDLNLNDDTAPEAPEFEEDASSTQYMLRDVPPIAEPPAELADSGLDLDLGFIDDTTSDDNDDSGAGTVFMLDQPETTAASDDELDLTLDIGEMGAGADGTEELDLDLTLDLEVPDESPGAGSGFGLDINAPMTTDSAGADDEIPELDFDLDDTGTLSPASDFETVQINPDDLAGAGVLTDEEAASLGGSVESIEVDNDFAGLFDTDDSGNDDFGLELPDSAAAAESSDGTEITGLDFEIDQDESDAEAGDYQKTQFMLRDIAALTSDEDDDDENSTLALGRGSDGELDEMQTKLDLAQAYIDMGDVEGARGILGEVMAEGDDGQQEIAKRLLERLN